MDVRVWMKEWGALTLVGGLLCVCVVAVIAFVMTYRERDNALVLATAQDCLRVSDPGECRMFVDRALEIHARYAPRFPLMRMCEQDFGEGACREIGLYGDVFFAPKVVAIVAARHELTIPTGIVPVYAGPPSSSDRVYFRGKPVGRFLSRRFGGAEISSMLDLDGQPVTGAWVHKLRKS
jgi:hypothetical protein